MKRRFDDFESFEQAFCAVDLHFRQLDRGSFRGSMTCVVAPSVVLTECALNRHIEQTGAPETGYWTFGLPYNEVFHMRWRRKNVDSKSLMLFRPGEEIDCVSNSDFHAIGIAVSEQRLTKAAMRRGVSSIDELVPREDTVCLTGQGRDHLRRMARRLIDAAMSQPDLLSNRAFLDSIDDDFVEELMDVLARRRDSGSKPMARVRGRALRKALEVIADNADEAMTVAEVEQLSSARSRTLRYAFLEQFGVSPKQYLLAYRLNHVRRQLLKERPTRGKISDVANAWGFWHMGEFAGQYRRMFGELPSRSVAKCPCPEAL